MVVRFVGWIVLGLLTAALPIASALIFRYNPRPRYVQRFYLWLAVALDSVALGGALADANALGLLPQPRRARLGQHPARPDRPAHARARPLVSARRVRPAPRRSRLLMLTRARTRR